MVYLKDVYSEAPITNILEFSTLNIQSKSYVYMGRLIDHIYVIGKIYYLQGSLYLIIYDFKINKMYFLFFDCQNSIYYEPDEIIEPGPYTILFSINDGLILAKYLISLRYINYDYLIENMTKMVCDMDSDNLESDSSENEY